MEATFGFRQAYLSQQLAVLREAGIIQDRRDGWNIFYRVVKPEIFKILDAANLISGVESRYDTPRQSIPQCPCPKCAARNAESL
jgi:ArsR family transcriptional regulator